MTDSTENCAPSLADVRRRHGSHALTVLEVVRETADTATFVLDVPDRLADVFAYESGQFCTVRIPSSADHDEVLRCYSMSSAPATDERLAITVKRVIGGRGSNWLHDTVTAGDRLDLAPPTGVFCERPGDGPILAFAGGSGVTPVFSIVKQVLATGTRPIRMLYANRDEGSIIFRDRLTQLESDHPDRLSVRHHVDADSGYLTASDIADFLDGDDDDVDVLVCGPTPFMDLVVEGVGVAGVSAERVAIERFADEPVGGELSIDDTGDTAATSDDVATKLTVTLKGKRHVLDHVAGDTVLEATRRAGLKAPFSCELGNCASCMALVTSGSATMKTNNALDPDEVDEGWVLTCQALPVGADVALSYDAI